MKFYNREMELGALKKFERIDASHFLVITGRRRVGKTELIRQFKAEKLLYFFVDKRKGELLLEEYLETLKRSFPDEVVGSLNWSQFIELLFKISTKEKIIVVFDEFQNFLKVDESIFSLFQKHWDRYNKDAKIFLITLGSYIGLMKKIFENSESPLFGRKTGELLIKPLDFKTIMRIINDMGVKNFEDAIEIYALFGGIPKYYVYLEKYKTNLKIKNIMNDLIFSEPKILKGEINEILYEQITEDRNMYLSVITAIADRKHSLQEIAFASKSNINSLPKYLAELEKVYGIIKRKTPITEQEPTSKKGRYFITDNFLKFWFRFIYRNKSLYELERYDDIMKEIVLNWNAYVGRVFENICTEYIETQFKEMLCGPWWSRKGEEIDIIALNNNTKDIIFMECKWQDKVNADFIIQQLTKKAKLVQWHNEKRKEAYAVFAKTFTKKITEYEGKKVYCFDLKDMEKTLKNKHEGKHE